MSSKCCCTTLLGEINLYAIPFYKQKRVLIQRMLRYIYFDFLMKALSVLQFQVLAMSGEVGLRLEVKILRGPTLIQ